jgi:hypothetical protein
MVTEMSEIIIKNVSVHLLCAYFMCRHSCAQEPNHIAPPMHTRKYLDPDDQIPHAIVIVGKAVQMVETLPHVADVYSKVYEDEHADDDEGSQGGAPVATFHALKRTRGCLDRELFDPALEGREYGQVDEND